MKRRIQLFIILLVSIFVLFSCSEDNTGPDNNPIATENWDVNIDDGVGDGSWILELMPDSTITASGSWIYDYDERYEFVCDFFYAPVTINGIEFSFIANGTTHDSYNDQDSEFTLHCTGKLFNSSGFGNYTIEFTEEDFPDPISGNWTGILDVLTDPVITQLVTVLEIDIYLQSFIDLAINVDHVLVKISRESYVDSINATVINSIGNSQFIDIEAGVYEVYYEIYANNTLTVSGTKDGYADPCITNIVNISESDWGDIPPTVSISFGNGFEFKDDIGNYVAVFDNTNPFSINFDIHENSTELSRLLIEMYQDQGTWYYWYWWDFLPDYYQNQMPIGFGKFYPSAVIEYGDNETFRSNTLNFCGYMNYYESPIIANSVYTFKIDSSKAIFSELWNIDYLNISDIYLAGEFNNWTWELQEYKLTQSGEFYEISLPSISSNQTYKFVIKNNNGSENWVPDVVNYRMIEDGFGGYNSITP